MAQSGGAMDQWSQIEQSRDDTTVTPTEVESNDHFIFSCWEDAQYGDAAEARRDDDDAQSMTVPQHAHGYSAEARREDGYTAENRRI